MFNWTKKNPPKDKHAMAAVSYLGKFQEAKTDFGRLMRELSEQVKGRKSPSLDVPRKITDTVDLVVEQAAMMSIFGSLAMSNFVDAEEDELVYSYGWDPSVTVPSIEDDIMSAMGRLIEFNPVGWSMPSVAQLDRAARRNPTRRRK